MNLSYPWLYDTVRARFDSDDAMEAFLPKALTPGELKCKGDDRYLSAMTQRIFQAGMQHSVVNAKWPAFEEAFSGFTPEAMVMLTEADIQRHMQNPHALSATWSNCRPSRQTPALCWTPARNTATVSVRLSPAGRSPTSSAYGACWPSAASAWAGDPGPDFCAWSAKIPFC